VNVPDFRTALVDYIREQAKPVDKFSHQPRLYALTREIGAGQIYDDDVVFAVVWLHDLGVFVGHRPEEPEALAKWECVAYAMQQTPEILARIDFPAEKVPAVVEAIRTHQPQMIPRALRESFCETRTFWSSWARSRCCARFARSGATRVSRRSRMCCRCSKRMLRPCRAS
jgi:hypothetical protein